MVKQYNSVNQIRFEWEAFAGTAPLAKKSPSAQSMPWRRPICSRRASVAVRHGGCASASACPHTTLLIIIYSLYDLFHHCA